ncbi:MAG: peptide chain release factor N(5)-glutamine methyltransferase [Bacteroidota bacterium]
MILQDYYNQYQLQLQKLYEPGEAQSIANWVFEEVLLIKPHQIKLLNKYLTEGEENILEAILGRLIQAEPVQYILGYAWFYGHKFKVTPKVLIPRNETEELVELVITTLQNTHEPLKVIDIGTGSGCIAISLQLALPHLKVSGIDKSTEALALATKNAAELGTNVIFSVEDILEPSDALSNELFDVIVSNPPYILLDEQEEMENNVTQFEPHEALFVTNKNPLQFYIAIADYAKKCLKNQGYLFFEIHQDYGLQTAEMLHSKGFVEVKVMKDINGNDRMIVCQNA